MQKIYFENLDGLRFLAFLSVFVSHSAIFFGYNNSSESFLNLKKFLLVHGDLGVTFFLVLSGFLLTYLFFEEKSKNGNINLARFYKKRFVRIAPVYLLTIIIGFFIVPFFAQFFTTEFPFGTDFNPSTLPWYLFFLGNIHMAVYSAPNLIAGVMWFISAQEQFYLFWPSVMKYFSAKKIFYSALFIIIASFIFRMFFAFNYNIVHYMMPAIASDIAFGILLAYFAYYSPRIKERIVNMNRFSIGIIYILIFALLPIKGILPDIFTDNIFRITSSLLPIIFSILFAFVIAEQTFAKNSFFKIGKFRRISYLGRISYGLYAYHIFALFTVAMIMKICGLHTKYDDLGTYTFVIIATFATTVLFAQISHKYFEQKFLKLKMKI